MRTVNKSYTNIYVEKNNYNIFFSNKKPDSAFQRLSYFNSLPVNSKEQAEVIQNASKTIFDSYNSKRMTRCGRFRSKISKLLNRYLSVTDKRSDRLKTLTDLFKLINDKCAKELQVPDEKSEVQEPVSQVPGESTRPYAKELEKLKELYHDNSDKEIKRLKEAGILTPEIEDHLTAGILSIEQNCTVKLSEYEKSKVLVIYGRALEIKQFCQETHYVFIHAFKTECIIIPYLIKELKRTSYTKEAVQHFKFLRLPKEKQDIEPIKKESLKSSKTWRFDHQPSAREELISCDAYLLNSAAGESALNFLTRNYSMATKPNPKQVLKDISSEILVKEKFSSIEASKISNLIVENYFFKNIKTKIGGVHVICVPKGDMFKQLDFVYRAHPYGSVCDCKEKELMDERAILKTLQADGLVEQFLCSFEGKDYQPQFRLLASHLKPEEGVIIKSFTDIKKATRKQIKADIRKLLKSSKRTA